MSGDMRKLPFHVVFASSEEDGHPASELNHHGPTTRGWISSKCVLVCFCALYGAVVVATGQLTEWRLPCSLSRTLMHTWWAICGVCVYVT